MFKNLTIGKRLALGFAVPLFMLLLVVGGVFQVATQVARNADSTGVAKYAGLAQQMKLDIVQVQQWLTDISATQGKDGLNDGFDEAKNHAQSFSACLEEFRQYYKSNNNAEQIKQIDQLNIAFAAYYEVGIKMAQGYIQGGPELGNKLMGEFDETSARLAGIAGQFIEYHSEALNQALASIVSSSKLLLVSVTVVGACALIIGAFMAWFITRSITRSLSSILGNLAQGAEQVSSASGQIASSSQSLAEGATEQAAGLEETSSSLEEMSSMTKQNADNAQQASTLSNDAKKAADNGSEAMHRMNSSIQDIQKSSDETAKIIKVIDEIAFQTNLLALNAAVEAARAGEAGKGFAVVAEEVRNLAMRSAEAAKNTTNLIEESVKNSKNGVDIAGEVGKVLDNIVQSIGKTSDLVGEIAAASQEQAQGIDQVNTAVSQMDKVTQQNAANAEESASASEELSAQAEEMNQIVDELAALVGGSAAQRSSSNRMSMNHSVARKSHRLSNSNNAFHQIASGTEEKARRKMTVRAKAIPLDADSGLSFDDFNS